MTSYINGEVWTLSEFAHKHNNSEYYRVKGRFHVVSAISMVDQYANRSDNPAVGPGLVSGVYVPLDHFPDDDNKQWVNTNMDKVLEHGLPVVCRTNSTWTLDLSLVNRQQWDTA